MAPPGSRYVIISPIRDEEAYLRFTLESVISQTVRPSRWVLVDDGSQDRSREIISEYAKRHEWMVLLSLQRKSERMPGSGVIRAFNAGYDLIRDLQFDFIVKLDCDVQLPADYFERLLLRFAEDHTLGIASGRYMEQHGGDWVPVEMPEYHAAGASKMVRAVCFADIGGFMPARGWDTVDQIRAQLQGWRTRHFADLLFQHLKCEGSGIGSLRTNAMHGEIYYLTGGGLGFFLLKTLHRTVKGRPRLLGGLSMLLGFCRTWIARKPRLVNKAEAHYYRALLNRRLGTAVRHIGRNLILKLNLRSSL